MNAILYAIWDTKAERLIKYFTSDNIETAKRDLANFCIETKQRSPAINLEEFELVEICQFRTNEIDKSMIKMSCNKIWETLEVMIRKTEEQK